MAFVHELSAPRPYRDPAPMPPRPARPLTRGAIGYRATKHSLLPLLVMAIAFVLPAARGCNEIKSPLGYASEDVGMASWIAPPFVAAFVLAAFTLIALVRRRSPRGACVALPALVVAMGVASPVIAFLLQKDLSLPSASDLPCFVGYGATLAAASVRLVLAFRRRGWFRWHGVLGAFFWMAVPVGVILTGSVFADGWAVPGAIAYTAALFELLGIRLAALAVLAWRRRRLAASSPL